MGWLFHYWFDNWPIDTLYSKIGVVIASGTLRRVSRWFIHSFIHSFILAFLIHSTIVWSLCFEPKQKLLFFSERMQPQGEERIHPVSLGCPDSQSRVSQMIAWYHIILDQSFGTLVDYSIPFHNEFSLHRSLGKTTINQFRTIYDCHTAYVAHRKLTREASK